MATKRSKRNQAGGALDNDGKPTKEELAVAKYLRFNCPTREGNLGGDVELTCFYGEDGVTCLLKSKWASSKDPLFTGRTSCAAYCQRLLEKGLFYRVKLMKKPKAKALSELEKKKASGSAAEDSGAEGKKVKKRVKGDDAKDKKEKSKDKEAKVEEKSSKKKKLMLDMVDVQNVFMDDSKEIYCWVYDPTPLKSYFIGGSILLGLVAFCLYPLWPEDVRLLSYYVSVLAMVLVGVILFLSIFRYILFAFVWGLTFGKYHFWLFPNLTEDCGFLESFLPVYTWELANGDGGKKKGGDVEPEEEKDGGGRTPSGDGRTGVDSENGEHMGETTEAAEKAAGEDDRLEGSHGDGEAVAGEKGNAGGDVGRRSSQEDGGSSTEGDDFEIVQKSDVPE